MEVNLNCLSSLSKLFEKQKKLKKLYPNFPANYSSPFRSKKVIEPYYYISKEGIKLDDYKEQRHEKFLLSKFIKELSKTNKELEKERKNYLNKLKYYNGENEKSIKLKKLERFNNLSISRKVGNILDLSRHKLKLENKRKEMRLFNNIDSSSISNVINYYKNEKNIFRQKFKFNNKQKYLQLKTPKIDKNEIYKTIRNKKIEKITFSSRNNNTKFFFNNSASTYFSLNNLKKNTFGIINKNRTSNLNNSKDNIKDNNRDNSKDNINENIKENIKKNTSYEKKWNLPKCFNFNKILGRNPENKDSIRLKKCKEMRIYNPNYDYMIPHSDKRRIYFDNKEIIDFNIFKAVSTRKTICNYINKNYSFDDNYNIINIINLEKEKKKKIKKEKIKNIIGNFYEYLKYKKSFNDEINL